MRRAAVASFVPTGAATPIFPRRTRANSFRIASCRLGAAGCDSQGYGDAIRLGWLIFGFDSRPDAGAITPVLARDAVKMFRASGGSNGSTKPFLRRVENILKRRNDLLTLADRGMGAVMREDITSSSFLAVIIVGLIVVCAGFLALGI